MERDQALLLILSIGELAVPVAFRGAAGADSSISHKNVETIMMRSFSLPVRRRNAGSSAPGNPWSTEDLQRLRELAQAGVPSETIAVRLRRTHSAIRNKAAMHGISLKSGSTGNQAARLEVRIGGSAA
jgi:hypothetical protein